MPPDGIKSLVYVYRSFVTCDDPKGVVDCHTIKISKIRSRKLKQQIKAHKTSKSSNQSMVLKAEKQERSHTQSSLQFMDLRGSLILLKEASNQLLRLKEKHQSFPVKLQRSRLCSYGSSRSGAGEIKKVTKDSLLRGNESSKGTNLIAKLMGLEEIPSRESRTVHTDPKKESECEYVINKECPEKRTLREILETTQSKGFTESDSDTESKPHCHSSHNNCSEQRLETMNGAWDSGWENGFSGKEGEKVVNDIEKLILSGLVEEFLS